MPEGILIDYNDGRPAMAITAGLRAPSLCGELSINNLVPSAARIINFDIKSTPGSQVIFIPKSVIDYNDVTFVPQFYYVTEFGLNNQNSAYIKYGTINGTSGNRLTSFSGTVMEIMPASAGSVGILVENSTDFTAIPDNARLMTAQYVGRVTVDGYLPLPVQGIPFGRWDNAGISVAFDGSGLVCRNIQYDGRDDLEGKVDIDLVIFNNTPPVAGHGITMTNSAGQVTFSTQKRPFVYRNSIYLSQDFKDIGQGFFPIIRSGMGSRFIGGYNNVRYNGIVMSGGRVRSERNAVFGNYASTAGNFSFYRDVTTPLPVIPNMY
ncbi:DUF6453 family protein [Citrobacter arsenatis]|uniref:DUF6453 family protein n=1 Tax=Citrobacter TaxID=544 RepID=UPI003D7F0383